MIKSRAAYESGDSGNSFLLIHGSEFVQIDYKKTQAHRKKIKKESKAHRKRETNKNKG